MIVVWESGVRGEDEVRKCFERYRDKCDVLWKSGSVNGQLKQDQVSWGNSFIMGCGSCDAQNIV